MKLEDHPTVRRLARKSEGVQDKQGAETTLEAAWLRRLAMDCGAHDVGLVEIARPGLALQRDEILRNYPWTKSLLSLVVRMAREPVRGAPRSVANLEFHRAGDEVNEVCAAIVTALEARGVQAVNPSMGFPMEMYQSGGGPIWVVSHKPVAVEAGDAEAIARRKFKNKTVKPVGSGLRPRTIAGLLNFMAYVFQPNQSRGLDATFHFTFTGAERRDATIKIQNRGIENQRRSRGQGGRPRHGRRKDLARRSREGEEPSGGIGPRKNPPEGQPKAASGLWQMLSDCRCTARAG